jgi:ribosomal protein S18 acetylase RimI-like enzyme
MLKTCLTKFAGVRLTGGGIARPRVLARSLQQAAQARPDHHSEVIPMGPEHISLVRMMMLKIYARDDPICRSMQVSEDDMASFVDKLIDAGIKSGTSTIAFDHGHGDRLTGIQLSFVMEKEKPLNEVHPYNSKGESYAWNVQRILDFMEHEVEDMKFEFLPSAHKILQLALATVDKEYRRMGLGRDLAHTSMQLGRLAGCDYAACVSTSYKSSLFLRKLGFNTVKTIGYDLYTVNGRKMFNGASMDEPEARIMVKKLEGDRNYPPPPPPPQPPVDYGV